MRSRMFRGLVVPCLLAFLGSGLAGCQYWQQISPPSSSTKPSSASPVAKAPLPAPKAAPSTPAAIASAPVPAAPAKPVKAALLAPLSGPNAALGQALSNAAQMAVFEVGGKDFTLLPFDSKGTPEGAADAARAARAAGADIVLGPLLSREVKAVAPIAQGGNLPVLAFTADKSAAASGIYALGFLPEMQIERVVSFARANGYRRIAVLARADEYGHAVAEAVRRSLAAVGSSPAQIGFYDLSGADIESAVKTLLSASSSFDALLLADDGPRLRSVAQSLVAAGFDGGGVRILGTMLWQDQPPSDVPLLHQAWYPAAPADTYQAFVERYQAAYGVKPHRLASLAYDATALAAVLSRQKPVDFSLPALTKPQGFAGVDGVFSLQPDGTNRRGLDIMELTPEGGIVKDRARGVF